MSFGIAEALIGNKRIYSINKIICLNEKKQYFIIYFKFLAVSFGRYTIRPSLQEILNIGYM